MLKMPLFKHKVSLADKKDNNEHQNHGQKQRCRNPDYSEVIHDIKFFRLLRFLFHDLLQSLLLLDSQHIQSQFLFCNLWLIFKRGNHLSLMHNHNPVA